MNKKLAFTLIELLVVIAVIGILSGLIVVSMSGITNRAEISKAQVFSNSLKNSLMLNLVSEWKFDGTTFAASPAVAGDVLDTWGVNNYNGTVTGHAPTVLTEGSCVRGSCLDFNGSSDYIDLGNILQTDRVNNRTFEVWVYPHTQSSNTIFSTGSLYNTKGGFSMFAIESSSLIRVSYDYDVTPYTASISCPTDLNKWNHLTFGIDVSNLTNTVIKVYKNGNYCGQTSQVRTTVGRYNTAFSIGTRTDNTSKIQFFNGLIDEARVYNSLVSISQTKERYLVGLNSLLSNDTISSEEYVSRVLDFNNNCAKK